jgi:hypothetical protein
MMITLWNGMDRAFANGLFLMIALGIIIMPARGFWLGLPVADWGVAARLTLHLNADSRSRGKSLS